MDETSKSKVIWGELEWEILKKDGIDVGCGRDPVTPTATRFDMANGDANCISKYVNEQYHYVFSSHCLEHMFDPIATLHDWWKLVRPGGYLFFAVPDEDLYEQGVFPSRFNPDHKATFTISKWKSWSNKSINILELSRALPGGKLLKLEIQDANYKRQMCRHGKGVADGLGRYLFHTAKRVERNWHWKLGFVKWFASCIGAVDQTKEPNVLAQIVCIVQKTS